MPPETEAATTAAGPADTIIDLETENEQLEARASARMKRGMALATHATPGALREAIACFDEAIALRGQHPIDVAPAYRYGLAAGWLNRAEALAALGTPDDLRDALDASDTALRLLAPLPLDLDIRVRRRLIVAWQNRGLVLQRLAAATPAADRARNGHGHQHRDANADEDGNRAEHALRLAAALLSGPAAARIADYVHLKVVVFGNVASMLAARGTREAAGSARAWARRALEVDLDAIERDEALAHAWLQAQHARCRALAVLLESLEGRDGRARLVDEATDAVDEGLTLARRWETRGSARLRRLAHDLVRFGCRIYHAYEPRFLSEFVLENLDPAQSSGGYVGGADMRTAALESLWLSFRRTPGA